jgi:predicted flap endonuclease-1-like 5' DNA nuclease
MANVKDIEGIGPVLGAKLEKAGIVTVESLLESGLTRTGRANIAKETGISESQILTFVNMADLMRVKGVGSEFAELLQAAGVDTIKELRTRNAENLHKKLEETNVTKSLTRRVPSLDMVKDFIAQAGSTDPSITY